jgi:hypothetical protein
MNVHVRFKLLGKSCIDRGQNERESSTNKGNYKELAKVRAPEWRSGLRHCISVLEESLQTLILLQAVSQPAVIGSPTRRSTTWHSIIRVRVLSG